MLHDDHADTSLQVIQGEYLQHLANQQTGARPGPIPAQARCGDYVRPDEGARALGRGSLCERYGSNRERAAARRGRAAALGEPRWAAEAGTAEQCGRRSRSTWQSGHACSKCSSPSAKPCHTHALRVGTFLPPTRWPRHSSRPRSTGRHVRSWMPTLVHDARRMTSTLMGRLTRASRPVGEEVADVGCVVGCTSTLVWQRESDESCGSNCQKDVLHPVDDGVDIAPSRAFWRMLPRWRLSLVRDYPNG